MKDGAWRTISGNSAESPLKVFPDAAPRSHQDKSTPGWLRSKTALFQWWGSVWFFHARRVFFRPTTARGTKIALLLLDLVALSRWPLLRPDTNLSPRQRLARFLTARATTPEERQPWWQFSPESFAAFEAFLRACPHPSPQFTCANAGGQS